MEDRDLIAFLHDHYKDTFSYVTSRETRRDRLFLTLILGYAVLALQVYYPTSVLGTVQKLSILGVEFDVGSLPLAALLDASWAAALVIGLKYCQTALAVERQYPYLHRLEESVGRLLPDPNMFCREGRAYLQSYPAVLNWAWVCYVVIFPLAAVFGAAGLLAITWRSLPYGSAHKVFQTTTGTALILSFAFYQVVPRMRQASDHIKQWKRARA